MYVTYNTRDETCHTLPKNNEHDWCNQPNPANIIGCHLIMYYYKLYLLYFNDICCLTILNDQPQADVGHAVT